MSHTEKGTLYIVSTPIGNMGDISERALDCLRSVDAIACEDTRHSGRFLSHLAIKQRLISYHDFNAASKSAYLTDLLEHGSDIALISDAGTPGVSDPAYRFVKEATDRGFTVQPVPGPSALLAAIVVSGLPLDRFVFEGFLPPKGAKRIKRLEELSTEIRTIVFYESPHKILSLVESIRDIFEDRELSVSRELTKLHEETVRGSATEVLNQISGKKPRGEYVVVVRGVGKTKASKKGKYEA